MEERKKERKKKKQPLGKEMVGIRWLRWVRSKMDGYIAGSTP